MRIDFATKESIFSQRRFTQYDNIIEINNNRSHNHWSYNNNRDRIVNKKLFS